MQSFRKVRTSVIQFSVGLALYAVMTLSDQGAQIVGKGEYRLHNKGGLSLNKWQSIESKMAPVMDQLLAGFPKS